MKISFGARGKEVRDIQSRLMRLNYDLGIAKADGVFGKLTEEAVKNFQARAGLTPTGIVDELTWQKLFEESLFLGERLLYLHFPYFRGRDVRDLQFKLVNLGFNPGPIDGVFGPKTEKALKEFQRSAGLIVDGICGPETLAFLEKFKGRHSEKDEVPAYPYREVITPFPRWLKIALFLSSSKRKENLDKNYLLSLMGRLSRIFTAWGIPCYFLETLSQKFEKGDLLLSFGTLASKVKLFPVEVLLEHPDEGLRAREGESLAGSIAQKLQERFPLLAKNKVQVKAAKDFPPNVLAVSFSFTFGGEFLELISKNEEAQQRLAGAITEGIKEYFGGKQKR